MSHETPTTDPESKLRRVRYLRHLGMWYNGTGEPTENSLLAFLYDIPYFGGCGVFPPLQALNEYLLHGGNRGGMSPGATWEPFSISPEEYEVLIEAIRTVPPESVKGLSGAAPPAFRFDPEFDGDPASYRIYPGYQGPHPSVGHWPAGLETYFAWKAAVCAKHRSRWDAETTARYQEAIAAQRAT